MLCCPNFLTELQIDFHSMKKIILLLVFLTILGTILNAQITNPEAIKLVESLVPHELHNRSERAGSNGLLQDVFDESLAPFYHGVASGDPLSDRVIIWTRITPDSDAEITGNYYVCKDTAMLNLVTQGEFATNAEKDYTVKIDVTGLEPATTYYYMFEVDDVFSLRGRTRTAPADDAEHLRFGVVSCSNYQSGYFNVYNDLSKFNDLDAILHLGDYIYEYGPQGYGGFAEERPHEPANEIISLEDYRARYSFYRLDEDLRRLQQQFPFINIWDDHETANDAYVDGAQNHDPETEGSWEERKSNARKAFFEWIPIRGTVDDKIYRKINYGNLVDLIMLDTRLEGRDEQLVNLDPEILYSEDRTILGDEQEAWFLDNLENSEAKWKIVGNQVIFTPFVFGPLTIYKGFFNDVWEAYPIERNNLTQYFADNDFKNIVVLTGDFHCTLAANVPTSEVDYETNDEVIGDTNVAVEFMVPSVTSPNFDEILGVESVANNVANLALDTNPHISLFDLINHGYFILDITNEKAQADWYYLDTLYIKDYSSELAHSYYTLENESLLQLSETAASPKAEQMNPAPLQPLNPGFAANDNAIDKNVLMLAIHPNPVKDFFSVNFALNKSEVVTIEIFDINGKKVKQIIGEQIVQPGLYDLQVDASDFAKGNYLIQISTENQKVSRKIIIQ